MAMSRSRRRNSFRLLLLRWHRRIGVLIALLVIALVLTGIPLNHSPQLQLDRITLRAPWLLALYGIESSEPVGYRAGAHWLIQTGERIFLEQAEVARCAGSLVGALATAEGLLVACAEELLILDLDGQLVERLGALYGLPTPLSGLALAGEQVWMHSGERWFMLDLQRVDWQEAPPPSAAAVAPTPLPPPLRDAINRQQVGDALTLERLLLDLHSGRLLGSAGIWLMDLAGLLLLIIAVSGCYVWLSKPGRFRRR